jgi:AcrR family transcriptional regulator
MDINDVAQRRAPVPARERIVSRAYALFTRRGVRAVGIDEIIHQSGVAKATMYRHFRTKKRSRVGGAAASRTTVDL